MPNNTQATAQKTVDPAQRAQNFAQATRQNKKTAPFQSIPENATAVFQLNKLNLGSKVKLLVEMDVKVTHASATSFQPAPFAPYTIFNRVAVDINNGFSPYTISGKEAGMLAYIKPFNAALVKPVASASRGNVLFPMQASASGATNHIQFILDLPFTLNDRDPVGLILLQNEPTVVTVTLQTGSVQALLAPGQSGYTIELVGNVKITPQVESYSIPPVQTAFPDISILKLVGSKKDTISSSGSYTMALPVGTTYRKLLLYFEDNNGNPITDDQWQGDIELIFNGADIPYTVNPKILAAENQEMFGQPLPDGLYVFDFSYQGIANYGGARDYVDTERLTEFWVRFPFPVSQGYCTAVYETLARLQAA